MNLGTDFSSYGQIPEIKYFIFELFKHRDDIFISELKKRFSSKFLLENFEGLIYFLKALSLLEEKKDKIFALDKPNWPSEEEFEKFFIKKIITNLKKNKELKLLFFDGLLKNEDGLIVLDPTKVAGEFTALRDVLINFKYLIRRKDTIFYLLNDDFRKELLSYLSPPRARKIKRTQKDIERDLENKKIAGEKAEKWVLNFEKRKFKNKISSDIHKLIQRISQENANAGYDITSIQSETSSQVDKFIEVKSCSQKIFYLTSNEMIVARDLGPKYFIYLVESSKMDNPDYQPIIIKNPAQKIFQDKKIENDFTFYDEENGFVVTSKDYMVNFSAADLK